MGSFSIFIYAAAVLWYDMSDTLIVFTTQDLDMRYGRFNKVAVFFLEKNILNDMRNKNHRTVFFFQVKIPM